MNLSITSVPAWLSIFFAISFITIPLFLIINTVKITFKNAEIQGYQKVKNKIILFYLIYFLIIAVISLTGFFYKNTIPPRIIITTTIPLFLFYLFYVQRTKWFKTVFEYVKLEQLIFINVFRFVGVFFFLCYAYNVLPKEFAFIGGSGDIISALLAILVVLAIKNKMKHTKKLAFIWNIIGLMDILSVITTATILTQQAVQNNTLGVQQFGTFPFSWIPAFAPATIVFLHILVFKKLLG